MTQKLKELLTFRERRLRRTPGTALASFDDARAFIEEAGVVTHADDEDLPSLIGAVRGAPPEPGGPAFGRWPAHAADWPQRLRSEGDIIPVKVYRRKTLYVARRRLGPFDTLARTFLATRQEELSMEARRLLDFLTDQGPIRTDRAREALGMKEKAAARAFHRAKEELLHAGIVIAREDEEAEGAIHAAILTVWTSLFPKAPPDAGEDIASAREAVLETLLSAAIVVPRAHVLDWFEWEKSAVRKATKSLLDWGRIRSLEAGGTEFLAAPPA